MFGTQLPTPIPVGSPYLMKPPFLHRKTRGEAERNQRNYQRRTVQSDLWLIDPSTQGVVRCRTSDISDAGVFATVAVGYGLAVGQRYEIRLAASADYSGTSAHGAPSLGYGTVIRLEVDVSRGDTHRIGFAIRFDVPQLIPI